MCEGTVPLVWPCRAFYKCNCIMYLVQLQTSHSTSPPLLQQKKSRSKNNLNVSGFLSTVWEAQFFFLSLSLNGIKSTVYVVSSGFHHGSHKRLGLPSDAYGTSCSLLLPAIEQMKQVHHITRSMYHLNNLRKGSEITRGWISICYWLLWLRPKGSPWKSSCHPLFIGSLHEVFPCLGIQHSCLWLTLDHSRNIQWCILHKWIDNKTTVELHSSKNAKPHSGHWLFYLDGF